mmetsp:Transcript_93/g.302  ORF Transcript_93/g.302 Transcript_93/m.302 type:complete len:237 (-) Transcript_93:2017-2727(-)
MCSQAASMTSFTPTATPRSRSTTSTCWSCLPTYLRSRCPRGTTQPSAPLHPRRKQRRRRRLRQPRGESWGSGRLPKSVPLEAQQLAVNAAQTQISCFCRLSKAWLLCIPPRLRRLRSRWNGSSGPCLPARQSPQGPLPPPPRPLARSTGCGAVAAGGHDAHPSRGRSRYLTFYTWRRLERKRQRSPSLLRAAGEPLASYLVGWREAEAARARARRPPQNGLPAGPAPRQQCPTPAR